MNNAAVNFAIELGITVAITTISGIFLGRFLDARLAIAPFGTLMGALLAIAVSIVVLVIRANKILK
jgi:hypothetical protein